MSAAVGGASALAGVVLAVAVAQSDPHGLGLLAGLGAALVVGAAGAGFVVVWQLAPAPRVVRVKAPAPQSPAQPAPGPPAPAERLEGLPGLLTRLEGTTLAESSEGLEDLGGEPGPLESRVTAATLEALRAGERPEQWVWVAGGTPRVLHAQYLAEGDQLWVSLEDHSQLQRCSAELRDSRQSLSLARDMLTLEERPEPAIARAFLSLNQVRAAVRSGSESASKRALEQLRRALTQAGLPSVVAALEGTPQDALRAGEAALRELEEMAHQWLPQEEEGPLALRSELAHHLGGRPAPRILMAAGPCEVPGPAIHALLGRILPVLLGSPATREDMGLDPEGLLRIHPVRGALELHVDGPGVDLDEQRVLRADPSLSDQDIVERLLEPGPACPFPQLQGALEAARAAGWSLSLHPAEPSGPTTRRVLLRLEKAEAIAA